MRYATGNDLRGVLCDTDPGYLSVMDAADALDAMAARIAELEAMQENLDVFASKVLEDVRNKRIAELEATEIELRKQIVELQAQLSVERMRP